MMRKKTKKRIFKDLIVIVISIGFFSVGGFIIWASLLNIPDFSSFNERKIAQSTKIYDRTGEILLYDVHQDIRRTVVPFEDMSRYVKNATIAIEDSEFYNHIGVRPIATFRAVFIQPLRGKGVQGGSTITQQVVKNSILTKEKKISRKFKEWVIALKLEKVLEKEEILGLYLNESPYGGNLYGIEEASLAFFGKNSKDITLAEASYLAALPQAPTYYSPYGNNKDKLENRKNLVLKRMFELNFINQDEYYEALKEETEFIPQADRGIKAPHFVIFIRSYLEEKYGKEVIENNGFKVISTLDFELQDKAEEIIKRNALINKDKFNAENAGLIAIDPKTGDILAMVGSRDYFDEEIEGNFNITLAHRQPGSTFKPFVYSTAFEKGYTPETIVFDLETQFQTTCDALGNPLSTEVDPDSCYMPQNYDNKFRGPITLRNALAQSINVPAIKVLYLAGITNSLKTAKSFGIKSLTNANQYGLTLVLGGGEVSLLDITSSYGVFANDGIRIPYRKILRIENSSGEIIEEEKYNSERVISNGTARNISDILSSNEARMPAYGPNSPLHFSNTQVAVKTGTTNDYRDAWIIGFTPNISVGVWSGNNDNSPMEKKVAGLIVSPMWREFMDEALKVMPEERFKKPPVVAEDIKPVLRGIWLGGETYYIDKISGKLANEYTPEETKEEFVIINIHNILYWLNKNNPLELNTFGSQNDPQFNLWEYPVRSWVEKSGFIENSSNIPNEYDDIHKPENIPTVSIISPQNNVIYPSGGAISVLLNLNSKFPISKVDYYLNGIFIGSSKQKPFNFYFTPNNIGNLNKENNLKVIVFDSVFNKKESSINFLLDL